MGRLIIRRDHGATCTWCYGSGRIAAVDYRNLPIWKPCHACDGTGHPALLVPCAVCKKTGEMTRMTKKGRKRVTCFSCNGTGYVADTIEASHIMTTYPRPIDEHSPRESRTL